MVAAVFPRRTKDPWGRHVLLSEERWEHVLDRHPELRDRHAEVLATVPAPDVITRGKHAGRWCYWAVGRGTSSWMFVVVDWQLRAEPYIVTAFSRRKGPTWQRRSS
jgi:hypothetical protein